MTAAALKPCPFCGGVAKLETFNEEHSIFGDVPWLRMRCSFCQVLEPQLAEGPEIDLAIAWNTRVPVAQAWQLIAGAPQDGTRLMLWDSVSRRPVFGSWRGDNPAITHYAAEPAGPAAVR